MLTVDYIRVTENASLSDHLSLTFLRERDGLHGLIDYIVRECYNISSASTLHFSVAPTLENQ